MGEEHEIIALVLKAQGNVDAADALIKKYLPFIKAETAKCIKRAPIEGSDDELGISMLAFYEAILAYRKTRGGFLKFAATAIRNRLIDYYRREKRHTGEISLETPLGDTADADVLSDKIADQKNSVEEMTEASAAREEIEKFADELRTYGLSLSDVAACCPKQERTLLACQRALEYAKQNPAILEELTQSKRLPIMRLSMETGIEKKTLERHRRYIVAIMLAYTNGFEIIRGHLSQMKKKGGDAV